jgi:hypothetical protein
MRYRQRIITRRPSSRAEDVICFALAVLNIALLFAIAAELGR